MAKYRVKRGNPDESLCRRWEKRQQTPAPATPLTKRDLWVLERVAAFFERSKLNQYVDMMGKPRRWFFLNIIGGLGRGIGMAIGFTILGAALFLILQKVVMLNLPIISNFFADILDMVESYRSVAP